MKLARARARPLTIAPHHHRARSAVARRNAQMAAARNVIIGPSIDVVVNRMTLGTSRKRARARRAAVSP
jgi:hypothetical protein